MSIEHKAGDLIAVTTNFDQMARSFVNLGGAHIVSKVQEAIVLMVGELNFSKVRLVGTNTEIWVLKSYIVHNMSKTLKTEYVCEAFGDGISSNFSQEEFGEGLVDYNLAVFGDVAVNYDQLINMKFVEMTETGYIIEEESLIEYTYDDVFDDIFKLINSRI